MALITPETKLCDVIVGEPSVVPVINRFNISLGVGDKTIEAICREKGIEINFFVTILNTFIHESYFPEHDFSGLSANSIVSYMRMTDSSYLRCQLPNIDRHFNALISHSSANNNLPILQRFYNEVKSEIESRIADDERWFAEILASESGSRTERVNIPASGDNSIEDKLSDLINMFVIYLQGEYDRNLCHAVLFAIISLEKDIRQNNRIRNRILYPLAVALNKE